MREDPPNITIDITVVSLLGKGLGLGQVEQEVCDMPSGSRALYNNKVITNKSKRNVLFY
jgi:hypothetical protein